MSTGAGAGKLGGSHFVQGVILAFLVAVVALAAAYTILGWGGRPAIGDPAALAEEARRALDAVSKRDLSATMTPPKYDDIMQPIDQMLREARDKLFGADYNPEADYDFIRARTEPIPDIADAAYRQAMSETTFLKKEFRFMEQKGDACRYWAAALWNSLEAKHAATRSGEPFRPDVADSNRILAILKKGLDGSPENPFLWYLQGLVERSGGTFAAAAASLEKAVELDPKFISAWNDLGLARINLKEFGPAEDALTRAKDIAERAYRDAGVPPGGEYLTALMNLADFHDSLASYYYHENQVSPGGENERELRRHTEAAESCAATIREYTPYDLPSEKIFQ